MAERIDMLDIREHVDKVQGSVCLCVCLSVCSRVLVIILHIHGVTHVWAHVCVCMCLRVQIGTARGMSVKSA